MPRTPPVTSATCPVISAMSVSPRVAAVGKSRPPERLKGHASASGVPAFGVLLDLLSHENARLARPVLPCEYADGHDAVEAKPAKRPEEPIPIDLALTDVEVLMDTCGGSGWVDDVTKPGRSAVVER